MCHSTDHAVLDVVPWISKRSDGSHVASSTTLDLSKDSDSADPDLLDRPEWYGVMSDWFGSRLTDREQADGAVLGPSRLNPLPHALPHLHKDLPCSFTPG